MGVIEGICFFSNKISYYLAYFYQFFLAEPLVFLINVYMERSQSCLYYSTPSGFVNTKLTNC